LALQVIDLFAKHKLNGHVLAYVKDEGNNIFTMTLIVFCQILGMLTPFVGAYWGHAISKCCQYATNDTKVCANVILISIKLAQSILQKTIISTKISGKGWQEWHKACLDAGVFPWKLKIQMKTQFASRIILF
jgi:hypothetical protein